jgi:hypothetical protein
MISLVYCPARSKWDSSTRESFLCSDSNEQIDHQPVECTRTLPLDEYLMRAEVIMAVWSDVSESGHAEWVALKSRRRESPQIISLTSVTEKHQSIFSKANDGYGSIDIANGEETSEN